MKYLPLILRNLARNKLRTLLTGTAIALAVALVSILQTMPAGLDRILSEFASNTRISVHNEAGLVYSMPYAYINKIRAVPGVVEAASWTWFGGVYEEEKGIAFPNFMVEPDAVAEVFADLDIDPEHLADFQRYRDGVLIGDLNMDRYGWKVGDRITLRSTILPVEVDLRIVGVIPTNPTVWLQREYVDQVLRERGAGLDFSGMFWVRVDDPDRVGPVIAEIDALFQNSEARTSSETEKSYFQNFFSQLRGLVVVILLVAGLVALCIVFIAANTASMSVRERMGEIAVLKAVGFRRRTVFGLLIGEATLLATVSGAVGVLIAYSISLGLSSAGTLYEELGPLGSFIVTPTILAEGLLLAVVLGVISGAVPAYTASGRKVAEILREVF